MKKHRKFVEVAARLWPVAHRHFEEMCALAVTGQLGGAQMCELDQHIAACESCRKFLESVAQISAQAMPLLAGKHAPAGNVAPPEGMRERFLSRLAAQGVNAKDTATQRPSPIRVVESISLPLDERSEGDARETALPTGPRPGSFSQPWRPLAAVAACLLVAVAGYYVGARKLRQTPQPLTQARPSGMLASEGNPTAIDSDPVSQLERQKEKLERDLARLKERLSNADDERQSLRVELAAAKEKLAALTMQAQSVSQSSLAEGQEVKNQVATLQSQVERLNQRLAESEVKLDVQRQTSEEVSAKLESTTAELQRERDLKSAKTEMGDLVAARNLHIVDVYDADPNGKRQRSFGRVFYIEGKSLVFYAYDLEDPGRFKANVVFHVWGGKAGVKEVTHSLGILRKDDAGQSRWAMTFDDPKVLAQINSVFVTAESANKHYDEPHGKKVLYAYFGSQPNHP
jgi:predicted  nucleic acid-binding Zn-ribbon protein